MPETASQNGRSFPLRRDQQRALHAYQCIDEVTDPAVQKEYKIAVHALGATILRSGLAGAMSNLMRQKEREAVRLLLKHLARAQVPHLQRSSWETLHKDVLGLGTPEYMLATRETLQTIVWFNRAVQATFKGD